MEYVGTWVRGVAKCGELRRGDTTSLTSEAVGSETRELPVLMLADADRILCDANATCAGSE